MRLGGVISNSSEAPEDDDFPDFDEVFETLAEWEKCLEGVDFAALDISSNDNPEVRP
ncbi:MAG: hypothetical protein AAGI03_18255 [Pseudomonadota bacterium]